MKIAVSAMKPSLNSPVDPRFGRCRYLIFVDPDTMEVESMENPNLMGLGGTGPQTAQFVVSKGAGVLLTGRCGPSTQQVLSTAGVQVLTGIGGTVKQAVESYIGGALEEVPQVTVSAPPYLPPPREELGELKSQLLALSQQLSEIQRRIEELELMLG